MTPSELANKIAEEVFRTIERDRAIVKAEIVDAVEKVVLQWQAAERIAEDAEKLSSSPVFGWTEAGFTREGKWVPAPGANVHNATLPVDTGQVHGIKA
jgi:hypothetical protein